MQDLKVPQSKRVASKVVSRQIGPCPSQPVDAGDCAGTDMCACVWAAELTIAPNLPVMPRTACRLQGSSSSGTVAIVHFLSVCYPVSMRTSTCCEVLPALRASPLCSPFLSQRQLHASAIATLPALCTRIVRSEMCASFQSPAKQAVQQSEGRTHARFPPASFATDVRGSVCVQSRSVPPSMRSQAASHLSGRRSSQAAAANVTPHVASGLAAEAGL